MVQKSENQSQKKTVDTVDKKRPKKAKIKGQKLRFRSVDSNKLTKNRTKKAKMRARKAVDTKRTKKAKIKGLLSAAYVNIREVLIIVKEVFTGLYT